MTNPSVQKFREQIHKPRRVKTPSGLEYTIRRLTAMDYIKEGLADIPNDFFKFVFQLGSGQGTGLTPDDEKKTVEIFETYLAITISKGVIDPPAILRWEKEKEDTHILWGEIPPKDQEYLIGCITGRIEEGEIIEPKPEEPKTNTQDASSPIIPK